MELTYDIKHKTFLSQTTFKIIGLILLGISQLVLATYILLYTTIIPIEAIADNETASDIFQLLMNVMIGDLSGETKVISSYKELISLWPQIKRIAAIGKVVPIFLLIGMFSTLTQERKKPGRVILRYGIFSLLFYLFELIGYYFVLIPAVDSIAESYEIDVITLTIAEAGLKSMVAIFGNFNIFIDMFICALFFFFVVHMPKKRWFREHLGVFRSFALIPVLYLVISVVFSYLGKNKIEIPLAVTALFSSRGIYAHIFFWIITFYYKYRRVIYENSPSNNGMSFKQYLKTNQSKFDFALFMGLVMLVICLFENIFFDLTEAKVANFTQFSLGRGIHLFLFVFLFLFFDFTRKPRFKGLNVLYIIYYLILAFVLFVLYFIVVDYAMELLRLVSKLINSL